MNVAPCFQYTPIDFGWQLSSCRNYLEIDWFHGDQVPYEVENSDQNNVDQDESDSDLAESDESESEDDADLHF